MTIIDYLKLPKGAIKKNKRKGRGQGSGHGKTACRGHKGQSARGNTKKYKGLEGGQMSLARRLPKRGFTNKYRRNYQIVQIDRLNVFSDKDTVNPGILKDRRLIKDAGSIIKILGCGKLKKQLDVHAHAFSQPAKAAIEALGGKTGLLAKPSPIKRK
jgi:large subunit ribosomal protein L15